jgi:hypothetical protein
MIIKSIDLALSRLKQGFDSPRERQRFQRLNDALATAVLAFSNFCPIELLTMSNSFMGATVIKDDSSSSIICLRR